MCSAQSPGSHLPPGAAFPQYYPAQKTLFHILQLLRSKHMQQLPLILSLSYFTFAVPAKLVCLDFKIWRLSGHLLPPLAIGQESWAADTFLPGYMYQRLWNGRGTFFVLTAQAISKFPKTIASIQWSYKETLCFLFLTLNFGGSGVGLEDRGFQTEETLHI